MSKQVFHPAEKSQVVINTTLINKKPTAQPKNTPTSASADPRYNFDLSKIPISSPHRVQRVNSSNSAIQALETREDRISPLQISPPSEVNKVRSFPIALAEGIIGNQDMDDDRKVDKLLQNFKGRRDFTYSGGRKAAWSGSGDCGTLVSEFLLIARAILQEPNNIRGQEEAGTPFFIEGGGSIIGDSRRGNVDGGKHWIFNEHVWILYKNQVIDVLFGEKGQRWITGQRQGDRYTFGGQNYYKTELLDKTEWSYLSDTNRS